MKIISTTSSERDERYITRFEMETEKIAKQLAIGLLMPLRGTCRSASIYSDESVVVLDTPLFDADEHIVITDRVEEIIKNMTD